MVNARRDGGDGEGKEGALRTVLRVKGEEGKEAEAEAEAGREFIEAWMATYIKENLSFFVRPEMFRLLQVCVIKYFSLYSVYIQFMFLCKSFALTLTFYFVRL